MTINSLNDFSITPTSNDNIAGTNISVGCPPQDVGVFMRTIMSFLAYCVQGTAGLFPANWFVGNLTASGNVTVNGTLNTNTSSPASFGNVSTGNLTTTGAAVFSGGGVGLAVTNGLAEFVTLQTTGSQTFAGVNGWDYDTTGPNPVSGGTVPIAATFPNAYTLAAGYSAVSDIRFKTEITPIQPLDGVDFVRGAKPSLYLKHGVREAGFIAQDEVRRGYGHLVATTPHKGLPEIVDADGLRFRADEALSLNYGNYAAYFVAFGQHVLAENEELKARIAVLEGKIS